MSVPMVDPHSDPEARELMLELADCLDEFFNGQAKDGKRARSTRFVLMLFHPGASVQTSFISNIDADSMPALLELQITAMQAQLARLKEGPQEGLKRH